MKAKKSPTKKAAKKSAVAKKATTKKAAKKTKPRTAAALAVVTESAPDYWNLRLYVAGQTPKSLTAFSNLKKLCEEHLSGKYSIEVVDLAREPHKAQADQIVALPTLVRKLPEPIKRVIGDLSHTEKVKIGLDLTPQ